MDHISEPTYCMLYVESQGCMAIFRHKVAVGRVHPGNMVNGRMLPLGYVAVTLDTMAKEMYTQLSWT